MTTTVEYAGRYSRPPRRPRSRGMRLFMRALGMVYWMALAGFIFFCASLCGFPLGMRAFGFAGVFFAILMAPLAAVAARTVRRRRAAQVLLYLHQATRLNLPLSTMLDAAAQSERGKVATYISDLVGLLHEGIPLGVALEVSVPGIPHRWVRLIDAAERLGNLPRTLQRLVAEERRSPQQANHESDASWWMYPLAVLIVTMLATSLIMIFVMPKFEAIFRDFGTKLPPVTQALLGFSRWVANDYGWVFVMLLPIAVMMIAIAETLRQTLRGSRSELGEPPPMFERIVGSVPSPLGVLHRDRALADACHVMADALSSGQTLEAALQESRQLGGSRWVQRRIDRWLSEIRSGKTPAEAARAAQMPGLVSGTVAAAEVGGRLDEGMSFLARHYGAKFSRTIVVLRGALAPMQALALGALVLFIILALLSPMTSLIQAVSGNVGRTF